MRIPGYWGVLASAGLLLSACAGHRVPPPSTDIDETVYRNHVRVLASDDFEGRKPGTPGEEKTVAYLVEQFRKLGLKPGNGESFLQQVPMVESVAGADATLAVTGRKGTLTLAYGKDMVIWSKRSAPQAEIRSSELVFAGYGIVAPEYAWNDYADIDVRGKTVLVLVNDPGYPTKDPKVFRGGVMTYYGRWAYKVEEAARQGAAGVLLVHDDDAAGYGWGFVQSTWTGAQLGLSTADGDAERGEISRGDANGAMRRVNPRHRVVERQEPEGIDPRLILGIFEDKRRHDRGYDADFPAREALVGSSLKEIAGVVGLPRSLAGEAAFQCFGAHRGNRRRVDGLPVSLSQPGFTTLPEGSADFHHQQPLDQCGLVAALPDAAIVVGKLVINPRQRTAGHCHVDPGQTSQKRYQQSQ